MARKPHNYTHFQNLVDELKDQNKNNLASLEKQLEVHAALLYSMRGLLLKGVTTDQVKLRKKLAKWVLPPESCNIAIVREDRGNTYITMEYDEYLSMLRVIKNARDIVGDIK